MTVGQLREILADPVLPDKAIINLEGCDCYEFASSASFDIETDPDDQSLTVVLTLYRRDQ